ncbi:MULTISPECIES: hypothetical protein [Sphingomonadales]|uniref:Uncharacterized protein n=2 Tax=Sphingomonadaceae TaxID=41297 RepID=T0K2U2_9SPHN|nr:MULTISPECIES: hypothetical protein [Sphingomonadaceae]EQB30884.1 hypothetical protein M529_17430 [Sphingobium ummariense RL-3]SMQ79474.1 hypothetical protein SAMN06295984_3374 [Sphingopyxis terrae subsp. ummariensis]
MIFQDGELRRVDNSKPMLFDGWAYVPMELASTPVNVLTLEEGESAPMKQDKPPIPASK